MKRIVFDARMYGLEHAGIGRYISSLVKNFQFANSNFEIFLLVNNRKLEKVKEELDNKFEYVPVRARHYSLFEQIEIPLVLRKLNPDLVHFPHFNGPIFWRKKFVVTIHDLIKHYFTGGETTTRAKWIYWLKHLAYKLQVKHALNNSALIFVPSQFWRNKLHIDFGTPKDKIIVTPEATEKRKKLKLDKSIKIKYKLKKPYLIYTGSLYPHKNINILLKALKSLPNFQLGIACSRNIFTERVKDKVNQLNVNKQVKFLGFVPDPDLINLYQEAVCLVQPSLMEGFGLTGLEAMSAGTPVVASRATCLPEVYGKAALYFDADSSQQLAEQIKRLENDSQLKEKMIALGRKQVDKYSWKRTAKLTIEGYKKALKS